MKPKIVVIVLLLLCVFAGANAQREVMQFFPLAAVPSGGSGNVQNTIANYIRPISEDFGSLANNGWYNTGSTHARFGFDLSVQLTTLTVQSESKYVDVPNLTGVSYNGTTAGGTKMPSAYGPESEFPKFTYQPGAGSNLVSFLGAPGGQVNKDIPIGSLAAPTIVGGIGLFANTDLRVKFTPSITLSGATLSGWGAGFLHDIRQHIKALKLLPIGLSLFVAYSQLDVKTDLGPSTSSTVVYSGSSQQAVATTSGYTIQVLVSKQLPVVTFYGGLGYNNSSTDYKINGSYTVDHAYDKVAGALVPVPLAFPVTLNNPFSQSYSLGGMRFTGGLRLKAGPVFINGDYTYYNSQGQMTLGFGFTLR